MPENLGVDLEELSTGAKWKQVQEEDAVLKGVKRLDTAALFLQDSQLSFDANETEDDERFQELVRPVTIIAQVFGAMPLQGVLSSKLDDLKFSYKTPGAMYSMVLIFISSVILINSAVNEFFKADLEKSTITQLYSAAIKMAGSAFAVLHLFLLFQLAQRWPELMKKWAKIEVNFLGWNKTRERKKLIIVTSLILLVWFAKCTMEVSKGIFEYEAMNKTDAMKEHCLPNNTTVTFSEFVCLNAHEMFLEAIKYFQSYPHWLGYIAFIVSTWTSVLPSVSALIVITVSLGLAQLFSRVNEKLKGVDLQAMQEKDWKIVREKYVQLVDLTSTVNDAISGVILATLICFIYLLLQLALLKTDLAKQFEIFYKAYCIFFGVHAISLTWMIMSYASEVNSESSRLLSSFYRWQTASLCTEAERLQSVLQNAQISLTGGHMVPITRRSLLAVTGFLITYAQLLQSLD